MDLTIPYTFYPMALPGWMSWMLFGLALASGCFWGSLVGRRRGLWYGIGASAGGTALLLFVSMVVGVVITFFIHDL